MKDETYQKALDSAARQYESYMRKDQVATPQQRRSAVTAVLRGAGDK